jgi:transcriptional regulator NrdR family protein
MNDFDEPKIFNRPYSRRKWVIELIGPDGKKHEVSRRLIQKIIRRVKEAVRQEKAAEKAAAKINDRTGKALEKAPPLRESRFKAV